MTDEKYYSVVDELNSLRTENKMLTEIVDAYRLAGKYGALVTGEQYDCGKCPVREQCQLATSVLCLHPSEYEAEWIKAVRGEKK